MKDKMDILACTDNKFVMPTGVMMQSVCENDKDIEITFHIIIDEGVTEQSKNDLKKVVDHFEGKHLSFYKVNSDFFKTLPALENRQSLTQASYYRLYAAKILPPTVEKILYLDGDIIARHSLLPLWNTDMQDYAIAGITDADAGNYNIYNRLDFSPHKNYLNAGVLLLNINYWRAHNVLEAFIDFMTHHKDRIVAHDQDVLNYVFRNCKKTLPIKFNLQSSHLFKRPSYFWKHDPEILESIKDPVIVHFTMGKPWYKYNLFQHPYRSLFFKYQSHTIWANSPLIETRSIKTRIIKKIATALRRIKLLPELPPMGEYIDVPPIE